MLVRHPTEQTYAHPLVDICAQLILPLSLSKQDLSVATSKATEHLGLPDVG